MTTLTIFSANICNYKIPLACFACPVCSSVIDQASNTYAYLLLFRLSGRAMGKSTKSTPSRPSILKNNRKYAGTPMKKPSCTFLRSVLVQTDWTFDNQIRIWWPPTTYLRFHAYYKGCRIHTSDALRNQSRSYSTSLSYVQSAAVT